MKDYKIIDKKLSKHTICILRNIELICFINPNLLKNMQIFWIHFSKQMKKLNYLNTLKKIGFIKIIKFSNIIN